MSRAGAQTLLCLVLFVHDDLQQVLVFAIRRHGVIIYFYPQPEGALLLVAPPCFIGVDGCVSGAIDNNETP